VRTDIDGAEIGETSQVPVITYAHYID